MGLIVAISTHCVSAESYNDLTRSRACLEARRDPTNQMPAPAIPTSTTRLVTQLLYILSSCLLLSSALFSVVRIPAITTTSPGSQP
jgi:hypothetical protein